MADVNSDKKPEVFKTYDDGYIVRAMTSADGRIVQKWYSSLGNVSRYDLDVVLSTYPRGRGFYVGEYKGVVVASFISVPWGNNAYYGSYYYVDDEYRGRGFGTRLRDDVSYGHLLADNGQLYVDALEGPGARKNASKFGYVESFITRRYGGEAKDFGVRYKGKILEANSVPLDDLISYDNKHFISKDYPMRRKFLQAWINIAEGTAAVALNDLGQIVGFGQRRAMMSAQPKCHLIGPLYADDVDTAMAILQHLCQDVIGDRIYIQIWMPNTEGVKALENFGFKKEFDTIRMYKNGAGNEYKPTVYAVTSIGSCGF